MCGAVPPGTVPANCGTDDPSTVSALSHRVDNQACQPLGLFSAAAPPTYALIDEYNPSYGFNLSYASPAPSSDGCTRSFHLIFRCGYDDWTPAGQAQRTLITETFNCQYETYTWTKKGCPLGALHWYCLSQPLPWRIRLFTLLSQNINPLTPILHPPP